MPKTIGTFQTTHASKYLKQLCKHFGHKVEVEYDDTKGVARFPIGVAHFNATETELDVEIDVPSDDMIAPGRNIIDSHLVTFAFREGFENMDWRDE